MKITVLMSTYNGERYLEEQLQSIRAQSVGEENIELVLRDDDSSDRTCELAVAAGMPQMRLIRGKNVGPADSFWELVSSCNTESEYYAFADQDDIWFPDKLERGAKALAEIQGPALYYSNVEIADDQGSPTGRRLIQTENHLSVPTIMAGLPALGCTMVFNRAALLLFRQARLTALEMHDRTCFLIMYLCGKIIYDDNPGMYYRQHGGNAVGNQGRRDLDFWKKKIRHSCALWFQSREHDAVIQAQDMIHSFGNRLRPEDLEDLRRICRYRKHLADKRSLLASPHIEQLHPRVRRSCRMRIRLNLF